MAASRDFCYRIWGRFSIIDKPWWLRRVEIRRFLRSLKDELMDSIKHLLKVSTDSLSQS